MKKAKRDGKIPKSAQQTIPYREMMKDGMCRVTDKLYTKTLSFQDVNYQLAQPEDKTQIFDGWCDFLNYFDPSIGVQLSFINQHVDMSGFEQSIAIPDRGDGFDPVRHEYADMLQSQLAKGNNGLVKRKFITFGVEADAPQTARLRMERIEADVRGNFKALGVRSTALTGYDRLELLHGMFHPGSKERFRFAWDGLAKTGLSSKDFIAPSSFDFRGGKTFKIGDTWGAVSFLQILAPELNDRMLADLLDMDTPVIVTLHFHSIDQTEAIKTIKRKLSDIEKSKIEEQKKAVRSGYDMDVLPPDLVTYAGEAKTLLDDLQSRNERMFLATVLVVNTAQTRAQLENNVFQAAGIAQKYNCALKRLDWQQEQGLMSSLPLGLNQIEIERGLTTSSTAIFVPFTTEEIFMSGEALYYGINALSSNLIMADRKRLKNPNGLILGVPGSGKSFSAKREMTNAFLITQDDILIADAESEYVSLVEHLGGQVVKFSPSSKQYANPMDLNMYCGDENPVALKSDFILSICDPTIGGKAGLQPMEKAILDRCVRIVCNEFFKNPKPENMPILQDVYEAMKAQPEPEAKQMAVAFELYVLGSLSVFNHRTNINLHNRLVCFDYNDLGKQLKEIAMLIMQDQIENRVALNWTRHKYTWYYADEFHLLLREPQTAAYSSSAWKRLRKRGGIPTGITQNISDLLRSYEVETIFENSDFVYMLSQAPGDRAILAQKLGISPTQLSYVTNSNAGEGLLFYGDTIIPFIDHFPQNTALYKIMTTRPADVEADNG